MNEPESEDARGLARLRNFGVVAHIDAGKTTLCERLLVACGVETRVGAVEEGTAALDWMKEERERGISITAAATHLSWRGLSLQLVDTPGHVDFTIEVERSLAVLDGAVVVFDVLAGVQAQSEAVWRQLRRRGIAAVAFVNKLDRPGADFLAAVQGIERRLGVRAVPVAYPVFEAAGDGGAPVLTGVVDLVRGVLRGASRPGGAGDPLPVPASVAAETAVLREELIEALALEDEHVFELHAAGARPPDAELLAALGRAARRGTLLPVACGSALHGLGVEGVLDLVVDCLPSPADVPSPVGSRRDGSLVELAPRAADPAAAFVFKLQRIARRDLVFLRVLSGTLAPGSELVVARTGAPTRVRALHRPHADSLEPLERARPGDIVVAEGLAEAATGDTLCDPRRVCALGGLVLPEPVLALALEPAREEQRAGLRAALARAVREDPSLALREDEASGQFLLSGMGELHLEIALEHLCAEGGLELRRSTPRVAYRERLVQPARAAAEIVREFGGATLSGAIELSAEPAPEVHGVELCFDPERGPPAAFRDALAATLESLAAVGPRAGFPLTGVRLTVAAGRGGGEENEPGLLQAAGSAWRELRDRLEVEIEEPLMALEVTTPAEHAPGVIGDLQSRGAELTEVMSEGTATRIQGMAPLSGLFGYASTVRSLSQGRATFGLRPAGARPVPAAEARARGIVLD